MSARREQGTWVQCTHCGRIHHIDVKVPINALYTQCVCPKCGEYVKAINCGDKKEDVYLYYDPALDEKYYRY